MIIVYNRNNENHSDDPNNYPIYRGGSILGNPYTHIKDRKTLADYVVESREKAIEAYDHYFDVMYSGNIEFKRLVDEIYEKYKNGETVYLECYCAPLPCHGNVIEKKLKKRLIKELIENKKCQKETKANTTL